MRSAKWNFSEFFSLYLRRVLLNGILANIFNRYLISILNLKYRIKIFYLRLFVRSGSKIKGGKKEILERVRSKLKTFVIHFTRSLYFSVISDINNLTRF